MAPQWQGRCAVNEDTEPELREEDGEAAERRTEGAGKMASPAHRDSDDHEPESDELIEDLIVATGMGDAESYSPEVVIESRSPANVGPFNDPDGFGIADGLCKDTMQMWVKLRKGTVVRCSFWTDGCAVTIACGSRLTKLVTGRTTADAMTISPEELAASLGGLPDDHVHCASLSVISFRNAVRDAVRKRYADNEGGL